MDVSKFYFLTERNPRVRTKQCPGTGFPVMGKTKSHLYLLPHPLLRPYIAHYTLMFSDGVLGNGEQDLTLIPDVSGCMVFSAADGCVQGTYWGPTTELARVGNRPEAPKFRLFVEFLPGGARRLTSFPQEELRNIQAPLSLLDPSMLSKVNACLERSGDLRELVMMLDWIFLPELQSRPELPEVLLRMPRLDGDTVREISAGSGYSQRHLSRLFREGLGVGMKTYLRLVRLNHAFRFLRGGMPFAWVAQEAGYYDQSHFIHDFQAICGVSPRSYVQNPSAFYYEIYKF